jgi:hypothetical protein
MKKKASDIVDSLLKDQYKKRRKGQFSIWEENNKELAELFWETVDLATSVGVDTSSVIRKFKEDFDGPNGSVQSVRRAVRDRSERGSTEDS